jgi:dTDP-4-dehydrorhamnose 3,5-epimerase
MAVTMIFTPTALSGAYIIDLDKREDSRGFFARGWCAREMRQHGLIERLVQTNISFNKQQGTLRGMHYQVAPKTEAKLIRCVRGALYDVIIDMRPGSSTQYQWVGVELTAENRRMLYVPETFAHGFLTLEDDTEALYLVSEFYAPECERGLRYNDPAFAISWPVKVDVISEKDLSWPDYQRPMVYTT